MVVFFAPEKKLYVSFKLEFWTYVLEYTKTNLDEKLSKILQCIVLIYM